jgi:hypothetical protein
LAIVNNAPNEHLSKFLCRHVFLFVLVYTPMSKWLSHVATLCLIF